MAEIGLWFIKIVICCIVFVPVGLIFFSGVFRVFYEEKMKFLVSCAKKVAEEKEKQG